MPSSPAPAAAPCTVLVLIVPAGHLDATRVVLAALTPDVPAATLIVPVGERRDAATELDILRRWSPLPIYEVVQGEVLQPGSAYVVPPHQLLEVRPGLRCALTPEDHGLPVRPLDQLLVSLALSAGSRTLVVFLGTPDRLDGAGLDGVRALRGVGATVLAGRPDGPSHADLPPTLTQVATLVLSSATLGHVVADLLGASRSDTRRPGDTGREAVEALPREVHADVHDLLERMGDAHCVLDREYRLVSVNAVAERLLGTPRAQLLGCSHWEAFPASVDAPIGQALRQVVGAGTDVHLTHHYTGEGHDLHLEVDAYPTGEGGAAMFWRDVTARVRAQEALSRSEEKYRALFTEMDEAYAVVEVLRGEDGHWTDFRFLDANPAFMQHTGMPYPVGRTATELLGTPNPRWAQLYGQVADTGEPLRVEEGELTLGRHFDLNIFRLGGQGSRRVAVLFTDITARRQAEEALRESERHYRLLFESLEEGFALAELIRDEDGRATDWRYLEVNQAWAQTGVPVSAAVGRTAREVNPQLESDWIDTYARVVQTGQPARYTAYAAGLGRWFETTAFRHSDNRFGLVFRDVTERKRREANQSFLVELSRDLSGARSEEELLHTAGGRLAAHLGLSCYHYVEVGGDRGEVTAQHCWHALDVPPAPGPSAVDGLIAPERLSSLRSGEPVVVHDVQAIPVESPATAGLLVGAAARRIGAYVSVPYRQDGTGTACFTVADGQARRWTQAELTLIQDVAHRLFPQIQRVRAAGARAESEGRLRALIEQLPGSAVFVVNRDLRYVLAQGEALSTAGYRPEDLVGLTVAQAMPTALVGEYEAQYRQALAGEGFAYEHEAHGRAFITRGVPLRTGGEEISSVLAVSYDITDRKRAEDALRASEERQAFLLGLADALRPLADPAEVQREAAHILGRHLGAGRAAYAEIDADDAHFTVHHDYTDGVPSVAGRHPNGSLGPRYFAELRAGRAVRVSDAEHDPQLSEADRVACAAAQVRAAAAVPLIKGERLTAVFFVHFPTPHEWTPQEVTLVEAVAERTWAAVERARTESALRASEARYRTIFESIDEGFAVAEVLYGADGRPVDLLYLEANPAASRLTGGTVFAGRRLSEVLPEADRTSLQLYDAVARTGQAERVERHHAFFDQWFEGHISPVIDAERDGTDTTPRRVAIVFRDVTERHRAVEALRVSQGRQAFLLELGDTLRPLTDPAEIQGEATRLLREHLAAGWCYYVEWDERGAFGEVLQDATREGLPSLAGRHDVSDVPDFLDFLRSGRAFSVSDFARYELMSPRIRARYGALGFRSMVGAPIVQGGRLVTTLLVGDTAQRAWREDDAALVREVADRTWTALARARAAQALRVSAERQAFLLQLSDTLRPLADPAEIQGEATRLLREYVAAGWCSYVEWDEAAASGVVLRDATRGGLPSLAGTHDVSDVPGFLDRLRTGAVLNVSDYARFDGLSPELKVRYTALGFRSMLVATLVKQGRLVASLLVGDTEVRDWSSGAEALLREVAERTWAAVERARAEAALAASETKYRTLFDSIDEGLAIVEMIRDEHGEIADMIFRQVNAAYERQGGLSGVVGRSVSEMMPGVEDVWLERYRQVAHTGVPLRVEDYQQDVGRWFDVYFARVDHDGRFVAIVFNDVTERKQRERQREFLMKFSDTLRAEMEVDAVAHRALELLLEELELDRCYITFYRPDEDQAEFPYQIGNDLVPALPRTVRLSDFPDAYEGVREQTFVIEDDVERQGLSAAEQANSRALGMRAMVASTARKGQRHPLSSLVAVSARPRRWSQLEIALIEETAERTWVAMERVQAERDRLDSARRFWAVANLVPDLLWESRPDGFTTWYNQRWLEYTGQAFEQATGWGWTDAIHPDDREGSTQRYRQAVEAGRSLRQEHRIRRHDGEYRWFVVHAFPLRDEHGTVVRVYGAATDIHHLRVKSAVLEARVEERTRQLAGLNAELASSNQAFEAFADLSRDLALHLDPYALIRRAQEVALSLLPDGFATYYEPEENLWRLRAQVGDMRHPALQAAADAGLELGRIPSLDQPWTSGGALFQGHYAADADGLGSLRHGAHAVATLPLVVGGRRVGVFAVALFSQRVWSGADQAVLETVVRNLGLALERADVVRALAEEREALAAFVRFTELTNDTGDVDTLARHAAEVLRAVLNVRTAVYFELDDDRWKARHVSGFPAPEYEQDLREGLPQSAFSFAQVTERREAMFFEPWDASADGVLGPGVYRAVARYPLFPQDHPAGVLGMAMSERSSWSEREKAVFRAVGDSFRLALERVARVQQMERQRERLADLNAELGNLITRTAHTLDAPAQRLSQLLASGQTSELTPLHDSETLQDEVRRLRSVAADLRHLAGLEQRAVQKELLPLGEVFGAVRAEVAATLGAGRLSWQIGPLPIVRGDRGLLRQALEVLMTFILSETRGARHVTVDSREVDGEVHVTVADDGLGLTGEEAATLFDLSVRTDQRVPVLEGSGLIQVRRILARHGGWVWAEAQHTGKVVLAFPRDDAVNEFEALFRQWPQDQ